MTNMKLMTSAADPDRRSMRECRHSNSTLRNVEAMAVIVAIVGIVSVIGAVRSAFADNTAAATTLPTSTPVPLGPQGQPELQALVFAGKLADLRWPDFSDYHGQATLFYTASGYALAWVNDGRPTAQASAMNDAFKAANTKGLNPEDYDVSRWDARIAKLAPATASPAATDQVHFDLALTICAMRYL